jgi:tetratricopeptide (TPR) repeat protein
LDLAKLCFLESADAETAKSAYVDQALRVRPFDGAVLFEAGREAWMAGEYEQGLRYWQQAFRSGRAQQRQLIDLLAGRVPVRRILESFQPDLHALRILHASYRKLDQPDQLAELRRYHARVARAEAQTLEAEEAAGAWLEAQWICHLLGDSEQALVCAQSAWQCDPNNYQVRYSLGKRLAEQQQFAEAEGHLAWCLQRHPGDEALQRLHREVVKRRIDNESRAAYRHDSHAPLR